MDKQNQPIWTKWVKEIPTWLKGTIGLITTIISFIILFRANVHLSIIVTIGVLLITTLCLCLYIIYARTPPLIEGGKGVYRFENYRKWAITSIFFMPLLVIAFFYVDASRSFILAAFFDNPQITDEPMHQGLVVAVSDFTGDPKLGSEIADEIEEALLSSIGEARLEITVLEGFIETQIDGPIQARQIAEQESIDLVVWGKIIKYGENKIKLIPRMYIRGQNEEMILRGRNLEPNIIDPSSVTLREESAINSAEFALLVFGVLNYNQGQLETAINILNSVDGSYEAEANFYLGLSYYLSGTYAEAIDHIKKAIELNPELGIAYVNLGMIYVDLGSYQLAYENFIRAENIGISANDVELMAGANSGLGLCFFYLGNYDEAEHHFTLSLDGYIELMNNNRIANEYGNLALVNLRKGQLKEAKALLEEALSIHKFIGNRHGEASDLSNLGVVCREQGDYSEALKYQNLALEIYELLAYNDGIIRTLGNIGINYVSQENYAAAEDYFQRELKLVDEKGDPAQKVIVLNRLGQLQLLQQNPSNANIYFQESLATYLEIGSRSGEAETSYWLGITYEKLGETKKALQAYNNALTIFREIGDEAMEQTVKDAIERVPE
jgi:tetratricopeptide (TPR) repeat protein